MHCVYVHPRDYTICEIVLQLVHTSSMVLVSDSSLMENIALQKHHGVSTVLYHCTRNAKSAVYVIFCEGAYDRLCPISFGLVLHINGQDIYVAN